MKKWLWLAAAVLVALVAYTVAGPWLTVNAIRSAVQDQDARALSRQVDFPAVRSSIKAQLRDRLARASGARAQGNPFAALGMGIASGMIGGAVDAMVTPTGLGAIMEGRKVWDRASGLPPPTDSDAVARPRPFADAVYRYESPARFTVTASDEDGQPLVFVLTRRGLVWRLSDIRLPR